MIGTEIVELANPGEALRNQTGKFQVTSPNGFVFQVTCRQGKKIRIREIGEAKVNPFSKWQIEKIA